MPSTIPDNGETGTGRSGSLNPAAGQTVIRNGGEQNAGNLR